MRPRTDLTDYQKQYIRDNWDKMTYWQIADHFGFKSIYNVSEFCRNNFLTKKHKKILTDVQKEFIRKNLFILKESEMAKELGISKFYIRDFKRSEGLAKNPLNRMKERRPVVKELFFNVDAGAGGSSQGARNYGRSIGGGVEIKLALNHWKLAIDSYLSYYNGSSDVCSSITAPVGTFTGSDRVALSYHENENIPDIQDCYYRTIKAHEVQIGMGFDNTYKVLGSSKDQVKQLGNAVTPSAMEWLVGQCIKSLN